MSSRHWQGTFHGVTYRTLWGRPQNVTLGHPQDVGRGRPLALHRGPYGEVRRTSSWHVLRRSSGRNYAEWRTSLMAASGFLESSNYFWCFNLCPKLFLIIDSFLSFCHTVIDKVSWVI